MEEKGNNRISAGSYDLNRWLHGGYEKDIVTMIGGPAGSGKTNFCLLAACSVAKKNGKVIFIDSEGGFSPERIKQIISENYEKVLENILVLSPIDFNEQKDIFNKLLNKIKSTSASLIIVDGMAMLYRLELGDAISSKENSQIKEVNKEVAKQMRILAEIARRQKIPVIITNQVYRQFVCSEDWMKGVKGESSFVGGDLFKYWSKCIIELEKEGNRRKAILVKHRNLPESELNFEIKDKGIFKRGWI